MLPLHANEHVHKSRWKLKEKFTGWMRLVFSNKSSRNLFLFLLLNLGMAFVELMYGIWTNSLGLISDSFHMFFDCTALLAGLVASLVARWRPNERYPYGYVRAEVLAGFVNGLFLLFIAFFIFSEAVERSVEPPEVHHERLFLVSVMGFLVNLIGIFAFQHGGAHHGHSHSVGAHGHSHKHESDHFDSHKYVHSHSHGGGHDSHVHSHGQVETSESADHDACGSRVNNDVSQQKIMQGVFLHILADTLGSVGVIISSILIHMFGWMIADPICSMFIAVLIALSTITLLKDSTAILMQRQPQELDAVLPACFHKVSQLEGVYSVQEPHFWTLCSDSYVGGIKLEVAQRADSKYILSQTHGIFAAAGVRQLYVQIDTAMF